MFSNPQFYRRGAEFAEKFWSDDSTDLGLGFLSTTASLCVRCVSVVNKYFGRERRCPRMS